MTKAEIKQRLHASNEAVKNGLPPDAWVVEFRAKNNAIKAKWKAKQPKKEPKPKTANSGSFKTGLVPHNKKSETERQASLQRWRENSNRWQKENKERVNASKRLLKQKNPAKRITANLRKRLSFLLSLHCAKKSKQTLHLLGCTMPEFMQHLQSQFGEGMSFDNYGQWHIDHKKPCNSFDLTKPEDQAICFHYSNLQPLWAIDNRIKSDRLACI
jgi:hypothetical protein